MIVWRLILPLTIIVLDAVADIGIAIEMDECINLSQEIGGADYAFEKMDDRLEFDGFEMTHKLLDFVQIDCEASTA